ncbi:MAG: 4Fe-4S dicluster domain-containing protein [Bacillota bacterium]|nr:4Fe-4S dicluster domain-containing protein [Bacillota bacterium]
MRYTKLMDTGKCIACRACQAACKNWNDLPAVETRFDGTYENPKDLGPTTWTRVTIREHSEKDGSIKWLFAKTQCMHCTEAACVMVCPTGAMHHTPEGTVLVDPAKCIACNYCAGACPFNVPRFDQIKGYVRKCTFCYDRATNGLRPMCITTCPTGALEFGDRIEIVAKAHRRVADLKSQGTAGARVYGTDIVGGTGVVYVLKDEPTKYGLPNNPVIPLSAQAWKILFRPIRALAVAALALGLLSNRQKSNELAGKKS